MTPVLRLRGLAALALLAGAATAVTVPARANELGVTLRPSGLRIHSAEETLREYCRTENGRLVFSLPGGASWELVTSTDDPAVSNKGDGSFHAFDEAEIRRALDGVRYPLHRVTAEIFILPYPRRAGLESAAGPGLILLSPGVRPLQPAQQQAEFVHELGHVVQHVVLPDTDAEGWERYRQLRGIQDFATYTSGAAHADRPHEIFAEDFRVLFGPSLANTASSIENAELAYPTQVPGLGAFLWSLADVPVAPGALTVLGGASHGPVRLARNGHAPAALDLFDLSGRRLATLEPGPDALGTAWSWNGRDASGREVRGTIVFARARDGQGGTARIVRVP